jgi:hypothetical protein
MIITDSRILKVPMLRQQQVTRLIRCFVNIIQLVQKIKEHGYPILVLFSLGKIVR